MQYHGRLYGKVGGNYFDTGVTSDDYDKLIAEKAELEKRIEELTPKEEEYKADFLWGFDDESIESIGYELVNARTEPYRKECWNMLIEAIKNQSNENNNQKTQSEDNH